MPKEAETQQTDETTSASEELYGKSGDGKAGEGKQGDEKTAEKTDAKEGETKDEQPGDGKSAKGDEGKGDEKPGDEKPADETEEKTGDKTDDKPSDEEKEKKEGAPEKYELKIPKDSNLSTEQVEEIEAYARAQGFSNEQAQAQLERETELRGQFVEENREKVEQFKTEWLEASKSDKEIGGDNFKENAELAARFVDKFGSKTLKDALDETGFGNHPELVRIFARAGKAIGEDNLIRGGNNDASTEESAADILYPTTKDKK